MLYSVELWGHSDSLVMKCEKVKLYILYNILNNMEVGGANPLYSWKSEYNFIVSPLYPWFPHSQIQPTVNHVVLVFINWKKSLLISGHTQFKLLLFENQLYRYSV